MGDKGRTGTVEAMVDDNLKSAGRDSDSSERCFDDVLSGMWNDIDPRGPDKSKNDDSANRETHDESSGLSGMIAGLVSEYKHFFGKGAPGTEAHDSLTHSDERTTGRDQQKDGSTESKSKDKPSKQEDNDDCLDCGRESGEVKKAGAEKNGSRSSNMETLRSAAAALASEFPLVNPSRVIAGIARGLATSQDADGRDSTGKQPGRKAEEIPAPHEAKAKPESGKAEEIPAPHEAKAKQGYEKAEEIPAPREVTGKSGGEKQSDKDGSTKAHFEKISSCGNEIQEITTPQGTFRAAGYDESGKSKYVRIAPGANDEGQEFNGSVNIKDGKVVITDAETGKAQEYSSKPVKYDNLSLTSDGKVDQLTTSDKSYRRISGNDGKDQYLVTTRDDQEGQILNGSVAVNNGKVVVSDNDSGLKHEYRNTEEKSSSPSLYDSVHQATVAATHAVAGATAAAAVDTVFKDPSKLQEWYNQAAESLSKAAQEAKSAQAASEKPAPSHDSPGEGKPNSGTTNPGEAKPSGSNPEQAATREGGAAQVRPEQSNPAAAGDGTRPAVSPDKPGDTTYGAPRVADGSAATKSPVESQAGAAARTGESLIANPSVPQSAAAKEGGALPSSLFAERYNTGEPGAQLRSNFAGSDLHPNAVFKPNASDSPSSSRVSATDLGTSRPQSEFSRSSALPGNDAAHPGKSSDQQGTNADNRLRDNQTFRPVAAVAADSPAGRADQLSSRGPAIAQNIASLERTTVPANLSNLDAASRLVAQPRDNSNLTISSGKAPDAGLAPVRGADISPTSRIDPSAQTRADAARLPSSTTGAAAGERGPAFNQVLNPTLNQTLNPSNHALNPVLNSHSALNPVLNQALNPALNPSLRAPVDGGRPGQPGRIDVQTAGPGMVGPRAFDGVQGRVDAAGRPIRTTDLTGRSDASLAVSLSSGKGRGAEGRYMIAELTLAVVLAAGGIRRVLPTDGGKGDSGSGASGKGRQIDRDLAGKGRDTLGADGCKFSTTSFKFVQLTGQRDAAMIRNLMQSANLESGRRVWLASEGSRGFVRALGLKVRDIPLTSREQQVQPAQQSQITLGFAQSRLVPVMAEAGSGRQFALPSEPSTLEQFLRVQQETLQDVLAPIINAAQDFIEIDDPFQSFKDVFIAKGSYRHRVSDERGGSSLDSLSESGGNPDQQDEDPDQGKNSVMLRPTCLVSERDTLIKIAEEQFSDPYIGWLIADLNKGNCREHWLDGKRIVEFQARQQLTLPVWQDIVDFYGSMPKEARPENLVTIVSATQIDREVVDNVLRPIMGRRSTDIQKDQTT